MTETRRPRDSEPAPEPAAPDPQRQARRLAKRGRSRDRLAYNAHLDAGADTLALHAALEVHRLDAELLAAQLAEASRAATESVEGGDESDDTSAAGGGPAPRRAASTDIARWVPIGPSVIRRGQAVDRPHVVGRIRDLAVSDDGRRVYAASAKGGLWYSEDAGATWEPVGAWVGLGQRVPAGTGPIDVLRSAGGNNSVLVCGALLVAFGATQSDDVVLVGTGELVPFSTTSGSGRVGGVGVLVARGPARTTGNPWELDTGVDVLEGAGIFRLARRPGRTAAAVNSADVTQPPARDEVLAATDQGLFLGVRASQPAVPAAAPFPARPVRDGFTWRQLPGIPAGSTVTDVVWITHGAGTRIIALVDGQGVEFSDDDGLTFSPVPTLHRPGVGVRGRCSIAIAEGNRAYVLYDRGGTPSVARIPDLTAATPTATRLTNVPKVWSDAGARDYDQAIAAEAFGGTDRLYLGGNTVMPKANTQWAASLWAMDVIGTAVRARPGVSDIGAHPAAGADQAGLVGNNVHADVHGITLPGPPSARRPVWVACDGGAYLSTDNGRVNSFAAMNIGLAVSETGFIDSHPVSSQFLATGLQDNGTAVRTGDTVWEAVHLGDGGGLAFAPTAPDVLVAQYIYGFWRSSHGSFRDPLTRTQRGPSGAITNHPEYSSTRAEFYSNCATVRRPGVAPAPDTSRLALGTDRVYLADNIASGAATTWQIVPVVPASQPAGTTRAAKNRHGANSAGAAFGVVGAGFGRVVSLAWSDPATLVVLYEHGILRQREASPGNWSTERLYVPAAPPSLPDPPNPDSAIPWTLDFTEVAAVPGSADFYVTTLGDTSGTARPDTVLFYSSTAGTFHPTGLRHVLDPAAGTLGPLDPAYSIVVDPRAPSEIYVGTKTGVWHGTRTDATGGHTWAHFANGLPEATVQDLSVWTNPNGTDSPRLLRAAIQSRGVWETDLAAPTPVVTYVRARDFDDRRGPLPTNDPRASATVLPALSSPDIVVRPAWPAPAAPAFPQVQVGVVDAPLTWANAPVFDTWTFQTAFRWWYPSIRADGQWTDAFGDLINHDRRTRGMPAGRTITKDLWDAVVGATRLTTDGAGHLVRSVDPAHDLAVFRPPWQSELSPELTATEVDIMECVVPPTGFAGTWNVQPRPSVVEVLLHHRASAPTAELTSSAGLMWRELTVASNPLTDPSQPFVDWWTGVSAVPEQTMAAPPGWTVVQPSALTASHVLSVGLSAALPRAVPIPIDLTASAGKLIVLAAFASSVVDLGLQPVSGAVTTLGELTVTWPHVAVRLIQVMP